MLETLPLTLAVEIARPDIQAQLYAAYSTQPRKSVVLAQIIAPETAAAMRTAVDDFVKPLDHPDRGVYELVDVATAAVQPLCDATSTITKRALRVQAARAFRYAHRSYQLAGDDHYDLHDFGVFDREHIEVTLDFSAGITGEGDTVYQDRSAQAVVTMPQFPCAALVLEREPAERMLFRYMKYLPKGVRDQRVYKLRLVLVDQT